MSRAVFGGKLLGETKNLVFDFLSQIALGETISSASVTATVYSGTDATPSSLISGSASISGSQVTQKVTGGVLGVTYNLTCTAITSAGQTLSISGFLTVTRNWE